MLFLNLLKLAEMFPRQPEKLSLYMQQHLLEVPGEDEDDETAPAPPPPAVNPPSMKSVDESDSPTMKCGQATFA